MAWVSLHLHDWVESAVNPWQVAHEERCTKCGEYRHRFFDAISLKPSAWEKGQHPIAQKLRDEGRTETAGYFDRARRLRSA